MYALEVAKRMRDFLRKEHFNYFWLGALGFTLNGGNCLHTNLHFVSRNEIRVGRTGHVSLLNMRSTVKIEDECALAWAKIVLDEFDTSLTLVSTCFY